MGSRVNRSFPQTLLLDAYTQQRLEELRNPEIARKRHDRDYVAALRKRDIGNQLSDCSISARMLVMSCLICFLLGIGCGACLVRAAATRGSGLQVVQIRSTVEGFLSPASQNPTLFGATIASIRPLLKPAYARPLSRADAPERSPHLETRKSCVKTEESRRANFVN